jgi:hypothetical protein
MSDHCLKSLTSFRPECRIISEFKKLGHSMRIGMHKGDMVLREPVVLINDPSLDDGSTGCESMPEYRPPWRGVLPVEVDIDANDEIPPVGTPVLIMCRPEEQPMVLVTVPTVRCLGHLIGPNARLVAEFIRAAHGGVGGTLAIGTGDDDACTVQVCVPGRASRDE